MFQLWQGIPGINPQVLPALTWERRHFLCFSTLQTLDYRTSKNIQAYPCRLICNNKKAPFDNLVSPRYPPQFLSNQSDRSSVVKRDSQKYAAFLPVVTPS